MQPPCVYYWTVQGLASAVDRFEWGAGMARSERFATPAVGDQCIGCHSLSRNGQRINMGYNIPGPGLFVSRIVDVTTRRVDYQRNDGFYAGFSPDSNLMLSSNSLTLQLIDLRTNTAVPGFPSIQGTHPDWSPDGARAVFAVPIPNPQFPGPGHNAPANLMVMNYNAGTGRFGSTNALVVNAGENLMHPLTPPWRKPVQA